MPKNLSLPALRRACGFTQADLAKKIEVSTRTIVAVENGTRSLTEDNARKIMFATGAHWKSLVSEGSPLTLDGNPYAPEDWERWRKSMRRPFRENTDAEDSLRDILKERFETLLESAASCGRIFLVCEEFVLMCQRLSVEPVIESVLVPSKKGLVPADQHQIIDTFLWHAANELEDGMNYYQRILKNLVNRPGAFMPEFWADPMVDFMGDPVADPVADSMAGPKADS